MQSSSMQQFFVVYEDVRSGRRAGPQQVGRIGDGGTCRYSPEPETKTPLYCAEGPDRGPSAEPWDGLERSTSGSRQGRADKGMTVLAAGASAAKSIQSSMIHQRGVGICPERLDPAVADNSLRAPRSRSSSSRGRQSDNGNADSQGFIGIEIRVQIGVGQSPLAAMARSTRYLEADQVQPAGALLFTTYIRASGLCEAAVAAPAQWGHPCQILISAAVNDPQPTPLPALIELDRPISLATAPRPWSHDALVPIAHPVTYGQLRNDCVLTLLARSLTRQPGSPAARPIEIVTTRPDGPLLRQAHTAQWQTTRKASWLACDSGSQPPCLQPARPDPTSGAPAPFLHDGRPGSAHPSEALSSTDVR
ncbi:hypothetical protein J7T55_009057 [Diaporthe amygdali]|uniref:uncharacterized protein n=1 Tax=Phomopsis amygdali TaxID=1214568 RepID=UPI0022FE743F|nr:uncharacterized protein J7T55_009057 [Diaporthe amygdali]KAJ0118274.1 hypothetical protein J7T55_009057 [Diaporthe amygdali]